MKRIVLLGFERKIWDRFGQIYLAHERINGFRHDRS